MKSFIAFICLLSLSSVVLAVNKHGLDTPDVVPLVRFLEAEPLSKDAPLVRSQLLRWEEKSKDVDILVCSELLALLPDEAIEFSSELLAQYMFGMMSEQLANPESKDRKNVLSSQTAGIRSVLKAYRSIIAERPNARIPEYDEHLEREQSGTSGEYWRPLIDATCSWPDS